MHFLKSPELLNTLWAPLCVLRALRMRRLWQFLACYYFEDKVSGINFAHICDTFLAKNGSVLEFRNLYISYVIKLLFSDLS